LKWRERLAKEIHKRKKYLRLSDHELRELIVRRTILSSNYDTKISLDFPHFCTGASLGCGGPQGWCYTFQGALARDAHHNKVAFNDAACLRLPEEFAVKVFTEISSAVAAGALKYPNLRFNGSGEATGHHVPVLRRLVELGVQVWGFSKNIQLLSTLREAGVSVMYSYDKTTSSEDVNKAVSDKFSLAYTSVGVKDFPLKGAKVVFPLHRSGHIKEVVESDALCPKVVDEYLNQTRSPDYCQSKCNRCHNSRGSVN
jgi:hypothetical protein